MPRDCEAALEGRAPHQRVQDGWHAWLAGAGRALRGARLQAWAARHRKPAVKNTHKKKQVKIQKT